MFSREEDSDEYVCPDCGKSRGSFHYCQQGRERLDRENAEWERRHVGSGKKVRFVVAVECFDTEDAIASALSSATAESFRANGFDRHEGGCDLLDYRFIMQKFPIG